VEEDTALEPQTPKRARLLDQVRDAIRRRHYSFRTEDTYVHWIKRFIFFSNRRHLAELGAAEVTAFLNYLARERDIAASTQNQALSALLFLYREVLAMPLPWLDELERVRRPSRVPTVLTQEEMQRLLAQMRGTKWLMASLLYGAGLRLRECLKLRVKDLDFGYCQIVVRDGKGAKDRVTMLPQSVREPLKRHLVQVRALHERDLAAGCGTVELRTRLHASIRTLVMNGHGSLCSRRTSSPPTRARERCGAIMSTRITSFAVSRRRRARRASPST
jgi:site-specific recombinase XerD